MLVAFVGAAVAEPGVVLGSVLSTIGVLAEPGLRIVAVDGNAVFAGVGLIH